MAPTGSPKAARQVDGTAFAASAAGSSTRAPPKVTPVPIPKPGSHASVPGQSSHPSATPAVSVATANEPARQSATPAASAVASRPNHDSVRPIAQDGRVRSPMPGKLKGKLDQKNGMFGVMLMTGPTTSDISKRDAEAKRASESTQLAAEQALASGQASLRSRRFIRLPPDPWPATSSPARPPPPPPPLPLPPPFYGFTDAGIKQEQARLLTVLRSLNPVTVVDQICTALAFFGGIPGAPPPPDGAFPPSAMANGSGRLFVSWIAEIFPPVPNYGPPGPPGPPMAGPPAAPEHVGLTQETTESGGKKRGRPKGSKSSRPRKDKGIKKGPVWARPEPVPKPRSGRPVGRPRKHKPPVAANPGEESWVDIDQDEEENEGGGAGASQGPAPPPASETSQWESPSVRTALPSGSQGAEAAGTPKKRGRPKSAKTRAPKTSATDDGGSAPESNQAAPAPRFAPIPQPTSPAVPQASENAASSTPVNSASAAETGADAAAQPETQTTKKGGRAKTSKNKSKADQTASADGANTQPTKDRTAAASEVPQPHAPYGEQPYISYTSASARQPAQATTLTLPQSSPQTSTANPTAQQPVTTHKRKRKSKNDTQAIAQRALQTTGLTLPTDTGTSEQQPAETPEMGLAPPPAKRQRKSKDSKPNAKSNAKASPNTSSKTDGQPSVANTASASDAARESYGHTFEASTHASEQDTLSLDVDHAISSLQSPHHDSHFDVESPTMENYQAQLQAQRDQDLALGPSTDMQQAVTQNRVDPSQLMADQLQQQHYQQTQYQQRQQQPRQQQGQQSQQSALQVAQSSAGHTRSPSFQQQTTESQQESPRSSQSAARASQSNFQYRPTGAQFANSPSYSPQQAAQPQFPLQKQNSQATQGQQYPTTSQQYNAAQQQYPSGQPQYPTGSQQQDTAQSRYPQQLVTAVGTSSYTATQSPQFAPTSNPNYHGSATNVNFNSSYNNPLQRSLTASAGSNGYRSGGGGAQNRSPSTFDTTPTTSQQTQQHHQRAGSGTSSPQSLQNTAALQSFAAGSSSNPTAAGWESMFDPAGVAAQGQQGHQNMASYGMAGGGAGTAAAAAAARGAASGAPGFAHSAQGGGIAGFDASGVWGRR